MKKSERRIADSTLVREEHWSLIFDQLHLGFWELNPSTGLVNATTSAKINLGFDPDFNFRYEDLLSIILPEDLDTLQDEIHLLIAGEKTTTSVVYRVMHKTGEIHWLKADIMIVKEHGNLKIYGTNLDITTLRNMEK